jgi:hypothetical protein
MSALFGKLTSAAGIKITKPMADQVPRCVAVIVKRNPVADWIIENALGDFSAASSPKGAKVVNQVSPGFTPFTGFDSVKSEKSQQEARTPGRPKSISDYGVHDV